MLRVGPPYRHAAIAADPLGHMCEVMLEPSLPLGKHLPATLVPVQKVEISKLAYSISVAEV
jgi:hypothetical protein